MKFSLKNILPRTLFGRSLLILVIPVLLIQVITTIVFFDRHWNKMTDRLAFAVAGEIAVFADSLEKNPTPEQLKNISGQAVGSLQLIVDFEAGKKLTAKNGSRADSVLARTLGKALEAQVRRDYVVSIDAQEKWVELGIQLQNGVMHVSLPQRRLFSSSGYIFLLWMISSSIILLAIAILFMRNQIRPIRRLAIAAERFGKGRGVPSSFKPEGAREVRQAGRAFLDMHERIKRQIQQRTAMLAGVSHDLRTPLTRMKLQAAMLAPGPDTEALKADISDMERMIDAYLDFARGEGGETIQRTDLKDMLNRIAAAVRRQNCNVAIDLDDEPLSIAIRPVAFERSLNNLVQNARKYGGDIWIGAKNFGDYIEISVDDNGPGIAEDKYDDVFKPFYREEPSRNLGTGGVGLGLPIAQDIIHAHGGKIWLEKSKHGGLRVVIDVPV